MTPRTDMEPAMQLALDANFGSVQRWREAFSATARAQGLGPWRQLVFQPATGALVNRWAADPAQAAEGGVPILALEQLAPGAPFGEAIDRIDWAAAYARYQHAVHAASEPFAATHDDVADAIVIDVRRAGVHEKAATQIPGARWRDPARVADWAAELPAGRALVVYCVYGHEVGRATAMRLRAAGLNARYLSGGIDGWQAAGRPLQAKESAS